MINTYYAKDMNIAIEFIKLAEQEESRAKNIAKAVIPGIIGMGMGGVAAHQLRHQLNKIQSPAAKNMARGALVVAAPIAASVLIPQIRGEWQKIIDSATKKKEPPKKD
jgi:hypothetical protein